MIRIVLALVLALTVTLAACGGDDDAPTATTPPASASPFPTLFPSQPGDSPSPSDAPSDTGSPADTDTQTAGPTSTPLPASDVTLLTLVDKGHSLPSDYVPPDLAAIPSAYLAPGFSGSLRQETLDAVIALQDAAFADGYDIRCRSPYRSYSEQEDTFNYWVGVLGYDEATRVSAMPGHSEHQLGTTCDLTSPEVGWDLIESFGDTEPGQWLVAHAAEYGFVLSYPRDKEATTGYAYEPWHWRYIGADEAAAFNASGLTLNQYLAQ